MVTEKEFNIIKALVEEEIEMLSAADCFDSNIMIDYLFSLSDIIAKLKDEVEVMRSFSEEGALQ